jgi:starch phosphorylase
MAELTPEFSSNRMLREYVERLYLQAADDYSRRAVKRGRGADELQSGLRYLGDHWSKLCFGSVEVKREAGHYSFTAQVYMGDFDTDMMHVQLYAEAIGEGKPEIHEMKRGEDIPGRKDGCCFCARIPALRPAGDYTPRIIPRLKGARIPLESPHILWYR